jgi:pimeloyl-ACP methyl ester carboxylesterase
MFSFEYVCGPREDHLCAAEQNVNTAFLGCSERRARKPRIESARPAECQPRLALARSAALQPDPRSVTRARALSGRFDLSFLPRASNLTTDPEHSSARKEMAYQPISALRNVKVPLLFIYGGADPWVPVEQSMKQLESLSKQQKNIRCAVINNASHEMMLLARETMAFDAKTMSENAPQAPGYFMLMASWLSRQVGN